MTKWMKSDRRRVIGAWVVTLSVAVLPARPASAHNALPALVEVMAGANGDSRVQFLELEGNQTGSLDPIGATFRVRLLFYDATGRETGQLKIPPRGLYGRHGAYLIATPEFARLHGAPPPDLSMPPLLNAVSGKVCVELTTPIERAPARRCLSYGELTGNTEGSGVPAPRLEIVDTRSLQRRRRTGQNADFVLSRRPNPTNSRGAMMLIAVAPRVAQGETLFFRETFQGNGRTCGSCHVAADSFSLTPANVAARFKTLPQTFDPLFLAETVDFDFNLNTLTLTAPPQPGDLAGMLRGTTGSAKVLGRVGPTTYLVYGGVWPRLSGTLTDGTNSATMASITAGDLNHLEDPRLMKILGAAGTPPDFPRRSLILENIPGPFEDLAVFRESPHLLNLSRTAPYGLSGEFADLRSFSRGAVRQHFPRSLARLAGTDFRLPTDDELQALEAFQRSLELPRGSDPDKYNLDRFATTAAQRLGRAVFFGPDIKCSKCHNGPLLNETDGSIPGKPAGPATFNTGVSARALNGPDQDNLPPTELGSDGVFHGRELDTPSLFNIKNTAPFFHDGSDFILSEAAVFFYNGSDFAQSPAGQLVGRIDFDAIEIEEINGLMAFLKGLVERPYSLPRGPVDFAEQSAGGGPGAIRTIAITNTSQAPIPFQGAGCALTGANTAEFLIVSCPLTEPLQPGESRNIQVAFNPSSVGTRTAILEVTAEDPSGVDLTGRSTLPLRTTAR